MQIYVGMWNDEVNKPNKLQWYYLIRYSLSNMIFIVKVQRNVRGKNCNFVTTFLG